MNAVVVANGAAGLPIRRGDAVAYASCPGRSSDCQFGRKPQISLSVPELSGATVSVHRCETCGLGVTRPAMPDVSPLYENRESEDFQERDSGVVATIKATAFTFLAKRLLRRVDFEPRQVIDFACGNGVITAAFAAALPNSSVIGLDFFETNPATLPAANYRSFVESAPLIGKADLLLCFHALEHDDDPHRFIQRLTCFVAPGGLLIIEVPNVDCVWTPWFGKACNNWYLPYHRLHFNRSTLRALMETNGLEIVEEEAVCSATIAMSLSRVLGLKYNALFFAAGVFFRPFQLLAEKLSGQPSALRIIVRKP